MPPLWPSRLLLAVTHSPGAWQLQTVRSAQTVLLSQGRSDILCSLTAYHRTLQRGDTSMSWIERIVRWLTGEPAARNS